MVYLIGWLSLHHLVVFFSGVLICSFIWAIYLSLCTCYVVRGRALGICQGGAMPVAALWCFMWGSGLRGNNAAWSALHRLSVTSPAIHKLGPSDADSRLGGFVYVLEPCGSLQQTLLWDWEFLLPPQHHKFFSVRGFEALLSCTGTLGFVDCLAPKLFLPI